MNEQTRVILAYTHWLYYAEPDFVEKVWDDDPMMASHFREKLNGFCNRWGGYMSIEALVRFDRELSLHHQEKLYRYIVEKHTDRWYTP
jgi:hypothetical protein